MLVVTKVQPYGTFDVTACSMEPEHISLQLPLERLDANLPNPALLDSWRTSLPGFTPFVSTPASDPSAVSHPSLECVPATLRLHFDLTSGLAMNGG